MLFNTKSAGRDRIPGRILATAGAAIAALMTTGGMAAAEFVGAPRPGQVGLPEAASPIMREMVFFHDAILLPIITAISLFVLGLMGLDKEHGGAYFSTAGIGPSDGSSGEGTGGQGG